MLFGVILSLLLLLTAFGMALLSSVFSRLFLSYPRGKSITVIPVDGIGVDIEPAVRFFARYGTGKQFVIFVDCGLLPDAKACVRLLSQNDSHVLFCKEDELYTIMKRLNEAE